jgi:hypothetical protein
VSPAGPLDWAWRRLDAGDRAALGLWAAVHLSLLTLGWAAAWVDRTAPSHAPLTGVYERWDAIHLRAIAQHGYFSPHADPTRIVFFPGYPAVLAAAHLILRNWVLSELAVSAVAGCFAVVSLSRLAGDRRAVLYLVTMPVAIFLAVGYAECLFLALAIPAWHAATQGRWGRAALLAGLSGLVRPDGVFLILALAVMALTGARGHRLVHTVKACFALAGPAAYEVYLEVHTHAWNAWSKADEAGWLLHLVTPAQALKESWQAAFEQLYYPAAVAFEHQLELAAMAVMILAALAFLWRRRWPEAVYCALPAIAIGTQTWYMTGTRTVLILFPIWIALAKLTARRSWLHYAYLGVSVPLAAVMGLLYLSFQWAG